MAENILMDRPLFSVCIPAYNRATRLADLLDSVLSQDFDSYEIVVCEDHSPERARIAKIVEAYSSRHPLRIRYFENEANLGYDANIRELVRRASGRFCFLMGNDDLMCTGALRHVSDLIARHPGVGFVLKSYAWFDSDPDDVNQEIRYFSDEQLFAAGEHAISVCFRRSGVISGYIVDRDRAYAIETARFDGTLYYQLYLTAGVLIDSPAVFTPKVLVLCRLGEPPDFGNSEREKGKFVPGLYTPEARLRMVGGALSIIQDLKTSRGVDVVHAVTRDYANYFYPYIKDQLGLSPKSFFRLYRAFCRMGFARYPFFHVYAVLGYLLGERRFDALTRRVRRLLGRSPQFGKMKAAAR